MKKVFDQTVRDIKKGVNKKVLKVPKIEQKVLDATSNESWGPHGSLLADIAQASRNYHEYQMIMGILWKRLSDTGKNWRHVYKGLTVLEYLVAHGSERVIDEIRERAYQISTLSDFQYIDSSGRDQGSNVRKKSQSLVVLVNDKERIIEVREKAAANRDRFRSQAAGGMYGDKYDYEGRYGSRDDDRNGYGRERDHEYRDPDRYSHDGDRYSRDSEDRYDRDGYRDDDSRGRRRSVDAYQHGSRGQSSNRDRTFDDDGQSSSRASNAKADDHVHDERGLERKSSEQNISAPPSYEEAVSESRSPVYSEREMEETPQVSASEPSPPNNSNKGTDGLASEPSPATQEFVAFDEFDPRGAVSAAHPTPGPAVAASTITSVPPPAHTTSNNFEMDLLGSLSDSFAPNPLAIMPANSASVESNTQDNFGPVPSFSATETSTQPFDDPFGDGPFKVVSSTDSNQIPQQTPAAPFNPTPPNQTAEVIQPAASKTDSADNFGFGDTFNSNLNPTSSVSDAHHTSNTQFLPQEQSDASLQDDFDILAGILPPSGAPASLPSLPPVSVPTSQVAVDQRAQCPNWPSQMQSGQPSQMMPFGQPGFAQAEQTPLGQPGQTPFGQAEQAPFGHTGQTPFGPAGKSFNMASQSQNLTGSLPFGNGSFVQQQSSEGPVSTQNSQYTPGMASQPYSSGNFLSLNAPTSQIHQYTPNGPPLPQNVAGNSLQQQTSSVLMASHIATQQTPLMHVPQQTNNIPGNLFSPTAPSSSVSTRVLANVPQTTKDKFETKSTVWADTLSKGLVNLNISGPKTNPLADIGVDFDAINRKDKRLEKPAATPVTSTITMGKAMGSGSGMGRAGAGALRPPPNSMAGSGIPMGGGYGGMNQQQPMGMGMVMNQQQPMGIGLGMNRQQPMSIGVGMNQQQPMGMGMNMNQQQPMGMGMGMNMGMGQGYPMQQPQPGINPGSAMPGGYNPMMGSGGYNPHQPYGGYQ